MIVLAGKQDVEIRIGHKFGANHGAMNITTVLLPAYLSNSHQGLTIEGDFFG